MHVDLARSIATQVHDGQTRQIGVEKGTPYIDHPRRVAEEFFISEFIAAAWLHDVLEDNAKYTEDVLRKAGIPGVVVDAVVALTRLPAESYIKYLKRVLENDIAHAVKIADINDNLRTCPAGNMRDKYELARLYLLRSANDKLRRGRDE